MRAFLEPLHALEEIARLETKLKRTGDPHDIRLHRFAETAFDVWDWQ